MDAADVCVVSSCDGRGGLVVRIGVPLADVYLEFLGGRCRPNTVLAAAYDLKVFFTVVARPPDQVRPADVLAFITAQRTGRGGGRALQPAGLADEPGGVSAATVRRRLSIVSGFFAFCRPAGMWPPIRCRGACRPAGSGPGRARGCRWSARSGGCRGSCPRPRSMR